MDAIEKSCIRKIYIRLLPFAIFSYFLAYIDRVNVSFAALTMRGELKITAAAYGFALGTFYWGYFIFEVPSNVVLEKVGARLWTSFPVSSSISRTGSRPITTRGSSPGC